MTEERFCNIHGPYDATYPVCPYCSGSYKRPRAPKPLQEDDTLTKLAPGQRARMVGDEEVPTEEDQKRRQARKFLDDDGDELLAIPELDEDFTQLDIPQSKFMAILWVKEGIRRGKIYQIDHGAVVARVRGDLVLDDPKVSNPHAKFTVEEDHLVLWDFGSRNGTFVNGERIRAATELKENDVIKMGDNVFVLKLL